MAVRELAKQIKRLDHGSKIELVRLVPDLLKLDELFILERRRQAREDRKWGRTTDAASAIAAERKRRKRNTK
jgi:hypothetical protein